MIILIILFFFREGVTNVTTQLESTTYLDCFVNRLGGKTVGQRRLACKYCTLFTLYV